MKQKGLAHTAESRLERIERRAYEARGGTGGREMDDWLQAEREIDAAPTPAPRDPDIIRGM